MSLAPDSFGVGVLNQLKDAYLHVPMRSQDFTYLLSSASEGSSESPLPAVHHTGAHSSFMKASL